MSGLPAGLTPVDNTPAMPSGLTPVSQDLPKGLTPVSNQKVTFNTSAHDYDQIIADATKNTKLDPQLLRAVGDQESGLGHSASYDPTTGLSKTPGNQGHGIFQADPASGTSKEDLARAAKDPQFAAQLASKMLSSNLGKYGNTRDALAAYNAGDPHSKKGQEYADAVLARFHKLDPLKLANSVPAPRPAEASMVASITDATKGVAGARGAINNVKAGVGETMDEARRHPANALLNTLSIAQRPTVAIAGDLLNGNWKSLDGLKKTFGDAWQAVVDPESNQKYVDALEMAMVHDIGAATHDQGLENWKASDLHGIGKFLADMSVETAADPLTYIPIADFFTVGAKGVGLLSKAVQSAGGLEAALKTMGPLAKSPKIVEFFKHYSEFMDKTQKFTKATGDTLRSLTNRREDLDHLGAALKPGDLEKGYKQHVTSGGKLSLEDFAKSQQNGFTQTGKLARMSIENTAASHSATRAEANADVLGHYAHELKNLKYGDSVPVDVQRHQLMEAWKYGTNNARVEAEALLNKLGHPPTAEERKLFPKAKGYINYEGPLQENYVTKIIPKGPKGESYFQDAASKSAYDFIKSKGKDIEMGFAKPVTKKIPPELANVSMYDLIENRMKLGNEAVRRAQIAHETANLYQQYGSKVLKTMPATDKSLVDWMAKYVPDRSGSFSSKNGETLRVISDVMKRGILGNPFPHGLINVGAVTLMHSNPIVWGRGLAYAMAGTPAKLADRLEALGGKTSFWRDPSTIPFTNGALFQKSQDFLERMETGFRASYLQHLDKTMGVLDKSDPNFLLHELSKGATTDIHIGAYAHPTKIAAWFKGLGGLYDTFRLDTVPRAGLAAIKGRTGYKATNAVKPIIGKWRPGTGPGQNISLLGRGQENFSQDFMPGGSELEIGPYNDFAKATAPGPTTFPIPGFDFLTSTATLGPVLGGVVEGAKKEATHQQTSATQDMSWLLDYIVPGMGSMLRLAPSGDDAQKGVKAITGGNVQAAKEVRQIMENLKMTDESNPAPEWVKVIMEAILGGITRKPESRSTLRSIHRSFDQARGS